MSARCEYLVLETSSHSIDQYRVWGINYHTAVITNVMREHLDYHKTMDEYRKVKLELFKKVKIAIINLDMDKPEEFLNTATGKKVTYSLKNAEANVLAENIELEIRGARYKVQDTNFVLNLPGNFNRFQTIHSHGFQVSWQIGIFC